MDEIIDPDPKKTENCTKKLMQTLQIHLSSSIKHHLDKAYEIGFADGCKARGNSPSQSS